MAGNTQLDVDDFINEEREADAREAYGDWLYECEQEERYADEEGLLPEFPPKPVTTPLDLTTPLRGFGPCAPEEEDDDIDW